MELILSLIFSKLGALGGVLALLGGLWVRDFHHRKGGWPPLRFPTRIGKASQNDEEQTGSCSSQSPEMLSLHSPLFALWIWTLEEWGSPQIFQPKLLRFLDGVNNEAHKRVRFIERLF